MSEADIRVGLSLVQRHGAAAGSQIGRAKCRGSGREAGRQPDERCRRGTKEDALVRGESNRIHTHTHTLTESRERQVRGNTPAETLRPAKLPSAKPPPATASSCCGGRRLPATPTWLPGNYLQYTYEPSIVYFTQARQHASEWLLPCMSWQAKRRVHRMTDSRHIHCDSKVTGA